MTVLGRYSVVSFFFLPSHTIYAHGVRGVTLEADCLKYTRHKCRFSLSIFYFFFAADMKQENNTSQSYFSIAEVQKADVRTQMDAANMFKADQLQVN